MLLNTAWIVVIESTKNTEPCVDVVKKSLELLDVYRASFILVEHSYLEKQNDDLSFFSNVFLRCSLFLPIMRLQAVSEKLLPWPLASALFNSRALIRPLRSRSTAVNHCCTSGLTWIWPWVEPNVAPCLNC